MKAVIVQEIAALRGDDVAPGTIMFRHRGDGSLHGIAFTCPCGCGEESWLPVNGNGKPGPSWNWNGRYDVPTLEPSVHNTGMPCRWHGWLRDGEWESC